MFDFSIADKLIAENSPFSNERTKLISLIIRHKKCVFTINELKFEPVELVNNGIIKIADNKLFILENDFFFYAVYVEFSKIFSYSVSENLETLFRFLRSVSEYFDSENHIGITQFCNGVFRMAIFHQHCLFIPDMLQYSITWRKEPDNPIYIFNEAFSEFMPYQKYGTDILLQLLRKINELLQDDDVNYNLDLGKTASGIRNFSVNNPQRGRELLTLLTNNFDAVNENISVNVIAGILQADKSFFTDIEEMATNETYQASLVVALSVQGTFSEQEIEKKLHIISNIKNNSEKYLRQLPQFYSSIIRNKNITNELIKQQCFEHLKNLIVRFEINLPFLVLHEMRLIKNHEREKTDLLITLLHHDQFDDQLLSNVSWIFFNFTSPEHYFRFLEAYVDKYKYKVDERIFEHGLPNIREKNPTEFDVLLIQFLTHNQGEKRWMAIRVFTKLSYFYGVKGFSVNILTLDPKAQFKLFTSILFALNEPKFTLPFILPLTYSTNDVVKEALINRLEVLTQDYGNKVLEIINQQWVNKTPEQQNIYERIHEYMERFYKEVDKKILIKELNPLYTQAKYYNAFMSNYSKVLRRTINENVDKKSIVRQVATTVFLARGGGWKHQRTGEITQLGTVGTNISLPRSLFISPDNFEWDRRIKQMENWENFLPEWQVTL